MAGIPSGEMRNDNIRNTQQPSFCPMKNSTILSNTPMPDIISKKVLAQQKRNVKIATANVSITTSGAAITLNGSLIKFINNAPFMVVFYVCFYLYFTIFGVWATMLS